MLGGESHCFSRALKFVEDTDKIACISALTSEFHDEIGQFGFETFIVTGVPRLANRFSQLILSKRWPSEWSELYVSRNYIESDPVARLCHTTNRMFLWSDAPYDRSRERRACEVMQAASEFGMSDGLCVPVHGIYGLDACISLGGRDFSKDPHTHATIQLIALYIFQKMVRLSAPAQQRAPALSSREREVMSWTAIGKSAWEIGQILSISSETVNKHIANSLRKLDASNKAHGVANALLNKEIAV